MDRMGRSHIHFISYFSDRFKRLLDWQSIRNCGWGGGRDTIWNPSPVFPRNSVNSQRLYFIPPRTCSIFLKLFLCDNRFFLFQFQSHIFFCIATYLGTPVLPVGGLVFLPLLFARDAATLLIDPVMTGVWTKRWEQWWNWSITEPFAYFLSLSPLF